MSSTPGCTFKAESNKAILLGPLKWAWSVSWNLGHVPRMKNIYIIDFQRPRPEKGLPLEEAPRREWVHLRGSKASKQHWVDTKSGKILCSVCTLMNLFRFYVQKIFLSTQFLFVRNFDVFLFVMNHHWMVINSNNSWDE